MHRNTIVYTILKRDEANISLFYRENILLATKIASAMARTLADADYKYIGRYLTKVDGVVLDKDMTRQEIEFNNYIYPYFKAIYDYFKLHSFYNIGVYGARNACRILKNKEANGNFEINNMFVIDASYGI